MLRDVRYHFPRAWLRREGENYLAKDELRGLFRGSRVILLERERRLDGACFRRVEKNQRTEKYFV